MSLKLNERYPGRFNNPSADYPQGSFKNRTSPAAKDGSYLEKDWANDKEAFFQSLLEQVGVSPNGLVDRVGASQYYDALVEIISALSALGFTPIQQGGGIGQYTNKVYLGWGDAGKLKVTVDSTDLGNVALNLDSVDNTSDVDKPVSTAQQTALNLKMNRTGDGAAPRLGAVSVNSTGLDASQQGAYLFWNETVEGRTSLVNNQGRGIGGFLFRNVNKDNTAETGRVTIDGSGSLSSTGSITAAGNIYVANGAAAVATDGNIHGSIWGGWLNIYITNYVKTNVPLICAAQGAGSVGTYALLAVGGGAGNSGPGQLFNGSVCRYASADANHLGVFASGTWRLMGYVYNADAAYADSVSLCLRVA